MKHLILLILPFIFNSLQAQYKLENKVGCKTDTNLTINGTDLLIGSWVKEDRKSLGIEGTDWLAYPPNYRDSLFISEDSFHIIRAKTNKFINGNWYIKDNKFIYEYYENGYQEKVHSTLIEINDNYLTFGYTNPCDYICIRYKRVKK